MELSSAPKPMYPITGLIWSCARATSGHAADKGDELPAMHSLVTLSSAQARPYQICAGERACTWWAPALDFMGPWKAVGTVAARRWRTFGRRSEVRLSPDNGN